MNDHDPITGELTDEDAAEVAREAAEADMTLSEQAAAGIQPPPYWRRLEAIMGDGARRMSWRSSMRRAKSKA